MLPTGRRGCKRRARCLASADWSDLSCDLWLQVAEWLTMPDQLRLSQMTREHYKNMAPEIYQDVWCDPSWWRSVQSIPWYATCFQDVTDLAQLPQHACHVKLSCCFTGTMHKEQWPPCILTLKISRVTHDIESLPESLLTLTLGKNINEALPLVLPPRLRSLSVGSCYDRMLPPLPAFLKKLKLACDDYNHPLPPLPPRLKILYVGVGVHFPLPSLLPPTLKSLTIDTLLYQEPLPPLPSTLQNLKLPFAFDLPLPEPLPPSLTVLDLGTTFNQAFSEPLPAGLLMLFLSRQFNQPLVLPSSLGRLELGTEFQQPLAHTLPRSLKALKFSSKYEHWQTLNIGSAKRKLQSVKGSWWADIQL